MGRDGKKLILRPGHGSPVLSLSAAAGTATDEMMAEINSLPQVLSPLAAGDVVVRGTYFMNTKPMHESSWFHVKFDAAAVIQAAPFVRGKPMIANHTPFGREGLPIARLFRAGYEVDAEGVTWGTALFFMLNDEEGQSFVKRIDSGIISEVSPTVAYDRVYCSICSADELDCEHVPGKLYDDQKCYAVMTAVTDILEVSFVWAGMQKDTGFYVAAGRTHEYAETEDFMKGRIPAAQRDEFDRYWNGGPVAVPKGDFDRYWEGEQQQVS